MKNSRRFVVKVDAGVNTNGRLSEVNVREKIFDVHVFKEDSQFDLVEQMASICLP